MPSRKFGDKEFRDSGEINTSLYPVSCFDQKLSANDKNVSRRDFLIQGGAALATLSGAGMVLPGIANSGDTRTIYVPGLNSTEDRDCEGNRIIHTQDERGESPKIDPEREKLLKKVRDHQKRFRDWVMSEPKYHKEVSSYWETRAKYDTMIQNYQIMLAGVLIQELGVKPSAFKMIKRRYDGYDKFVHRFLLGRRCLDSRTTTRRGSFDTITLGKGMVAGEVREAIDFNNIEGYRFLPSQFKKIGEFWVATRAYPVGLGNIDSIKRDGDTINVKASGSTDIRIMSGCTIRPNSASNPTYHDNDKIYECLISLDINS